MRGGRQLLDERALRRLLDGLAAEADTPSDEELVRLARTAAHGDREHVLQLGGRRAAARRPSPRARWALALAATAGLTLLGGIGLGRQLAPAAESAQPPVLPAVGPAFRPAAGWSVVEDGIAVPPGTRAALAANVPLATGDEPLDLAPRHVLAALPPSGILVAVAATPAAAGREQAGALRLDAVEPRTRWQGPEGRERALAEYALRGRRGGLDLDVRIYLGTAEPTRAQLAEAQAQLDRLLVRTAASQVTITVRPTVARWAETIAVSGAVAGGRGGQPVLIEIRECGSAHWRVYDSATTTSGGQWHTQTMVGISATLRARAGDAVSAPVRVATRPALTLQRTGGRPRASVGGTRSFWRREVVLQRFDPRRQSWVAVARARVTESGGAGNYVWGQATFSTARLVRGTLYRAVMTNQQTGPCYVAGFSNMVRG